MTDYNIDHPLLTRSGLPKAVREQLIDYGYGSWEEHPQFFGHAAFLLRVHGFFRDGSERVVVMAEALLESGAPDALEGSELRELQYLGRRLIEVAHHHHQIEDEHLFPICAQIWTPLADGLALLESDHLVLAEALDGLSRTIYPQEGAAGVEALDAIHTKATHLRLVLSRHLADEEEIVIPMLLDGRVG